MGAVVFAMVTIHIVVEGKNKDFDATPNDAGDVNDSNDNFEDGSVDNIDRRSNKVPFPWKIADIFEEIPLNFRILPKAF